MRQTGRDELRLIRIFGTQTNPDERELIPTGQKSVVPSNSVVLLSIQEAWRPKMPI
jgi:hypothetical protein